jgi:hypothetical protein
VKRERRDNVELTESESESKRKETNELSWSV